jgi:hypothetical protein
MARTRIDIDDNDSLDGADLADQAPEPDDEDVRARRLPRPRTRGHGGDVREVWRVQRRGRTTPRVARG